MAELKTCTWCGEEKELSNFSLTPAGHPRSHCKACRVKKNKYRYPKAYSMTYEEVIELKENQGCKCAICSIDEKELSRGLFVDHNHTTGKVRGLLCSKCNSMLGMAEDNIDTLIAAISYLKETNNG